MYPDHGRFYYTKNYNLKILDQIMIFLTDYKFWADHEQELFEWCKTHGCTFTGMTVGIPDEQTLSLFVLKWS